MFRFRQLFILPALFFSLILPPAAEAEGPLRETFFKFSPDSMKEMSAFISGFAELGMLNFKAGELLDEDNPEKMIHFGIRHNYVNNYENRVQECKTQNCPFGSLTIDGKYVQESVGRYFGCDLEQCSTVESEDYYYYFDGERYHFDGGAAGKKIYYALLGRAWSSDAGLVEMMGCIYNVETDELAGYFNAVARPRKWDGKDTLTILSMETNLLQE